MDFVLDADQQAILDAVGTITSRYAGAARMRELGGDEPAYDHDLHKHLSEAGYLELAGADGSRLEAALVVEHVSGALGVVAAGYQSLVLPTLGIATEGPIAVVSEGGSSLARFAADAEAIVLVGADGVHVVWPKPGRSARVRSRMGWPVGDTAGALTADDARVESLDVDPERVRAWWRVAVAVEMVGAMRSALELTVQHVSERNQFGRPIGSFQAVQHGLAECAVAVEGARWLAYEAAWSGDSTAAATAITAGLSASARVRRDTHQYTGALGFTTEYDLHLSTMRMAALAIESATIGSSPAAAASGRWSLA